MIIEHDNIIYMSDIPNVGGTSTYVLELAKRYKDRDIAIVYKTYQSEMIQKLKKYCMVYKLNPEDRIKCKVMVINYDSSVCDQVLEGKIYMTIHADYSNPMYGGHPDFRDRIDGYIAITGHIQKWLKEKCDKDSKLIYNPLTIEDTEKPIIIVGATRMSNEKGRARTLALANALDRKNKNYIILVFTPNQDDLHHPRIFYLKPCTGVEKYLPMATYGLQLSDSEGLSYTINEFLYRNIPVITTPLPYLDEIGFKDGKTGYIVNFDCSNVDEVAEKISNVPKFEFKHLKDSYDEIFVDGKSHYQEDLHTFVDVECIFQGMQNGFADVETGNFRKFGERWQVNKIRARELLENPNKLVKLVEKEV